MRESIDEIVAELGERGVVTEEAAMARHLADMIGSTPVPPVAVLCPASTEETSTAVKWCARREFAIVPQGGLTGLSSGAVPLSDGKSVILSTHRMNRIREVDPLNNSMTVEAGVVLADAKAAAEEVERYLPLSHGGQGSSQIGGNLSTNSGGNNALRYGTARDQVMGLEVVLPDGTVWNGMRKLRKNTAGYDLKQFFIGGEGTLGVITAAVLKLRPLPRNRVTAFAAVQSPEAALRVLRRLEATLGETVAAFELIGRTALEQGLSAEGVAMPLAEPADWCVLVEVETPALSFDISAALEEGLAACIESGDVADAVIAQSVAQRQAMWRLREAIAVVFIEDKHSLKNDTAVPAGNVPDYIANATAAVSEYLPGVRPAPFGHVGDGNIHFNLLRPQTMSGPDFHARHETLKKIVEEEALKLGGTISAEHGIGAIRRKSFDLSADPVEKDLMRRLRKALDDNRMFNPDVLL